MSDPTKPLGRRAYGSIPHLPGSRLGAGDHHITEGQARICLEKCRPNDTIVVQSKLDGSCVSVAKIGGVCIPLIRAGYRAVSSKYKQHRMFDLWVMQNLARFDAILAEGERICGEWLAQAHGTRYNLPHEPFVAFDILTEVPYETAEGKVLLHDMRLCYAEFKKRVEAYLPIPRLLFHGSSSYSVEEALRALEDRSTHGEIDEAEGAVWRVETDGEVNFLAKYVRHDKVDGKYLPVRTGASEIWNWLPT